MAAGLGDLPLLRLVLRVLPHAVRTSEARSPWSPCERRRRVDSERAEGTLLMILWRLQTQLIDTPRPLEAQVGSLAWLGSQMEKSSRSGSVRPPCLLLQALQLRQARRGDTVPLCPMQGQLPDWCGRAVLTFCALAQALLEAGATPIPLEPALLAGACDPPVPGIVSVMPSWAHEPLRWGQRACGVCVAQGACAEASCMAYPGACH